MCTVEKSKIYKIINNPFKNIKKKSTLKKNVRNFHVNLIDKQYLDGGRLCERKTLCAIERGEERSVAREEKEQERNEKRSPYFSNFTA